MCVYYMCWWRWLACGGRGAIAVFYRLHFKLLNSLNSVFTRTTFKNFLGFDSLLVFSLTFSRFPIWVFVFDLVRIEFVERTFQCTKQTCKRGDIVRKRNSHWHILVFITHSVEIRFLLPSVRTFILAFVLSFQIYIFCFLFLSFFVSFLYHCDLLGKGIQFFNLESSQTFEKLFIDTHTRSLGETDSLHFYVWSWL